MTDKEYQKMVADARRSVSRKYGFRQSSYINFKIEGDFFFCLYFLADEARLNVKPMYADDLWWKIWNANENKKGPLSLRGTGAYSLSGQVLSSYKITKVTDKGELTDIIEGVFQNAKDAISKFITANPDANTYFPDESKMDYDPDRLLYLMALIHNGKKDNALKIIKEARKNKHRCIFHSGMFSDSYTYIRRWCIREQSSNRFWKFEAMMPLCGFLLLCQIIIGLICNGAEFEAYNGVLILLFPALCLYFTISGIPTWLLYKGNSWVRLAGYLYMISTVLLIVPLFIFLYDWNPVTANMRPENIPVNEGKYITDNELVIIICASWAVLLIVPVLITSYLTKRWIVNIKNTLEN